MSNSDRWSKASSDSEASLFLVQGELRLDVPRAVDLQDALLDKVAFVSGGRDKTGALVISSPKRENGEDVELPVLQRVLNYLSAIQRTDEKDKGFSLLIEPKSASGTHIKSLFKWLQEHYSLKVNCVYVHKAEGFNERPKSIVNSGKYKFEVMLSASNTLFQHITMDQLTEEFGGTLKYNQRRWLSMRMVFEKFLFESMALSTKLDEIKQSLLQENLSNTVDGIRGQLQHHQHVRKWIVKAPIEVLQEESVRVTGVVMESSGATSEESMSDECRNIVSQVRSMVQTLHDQREYLRGLWLSRKVLLEQRYQFNVYKEDAEKMLNWIQENRREFLVDYTEIGGDLATTQELVEEHQAFEATCYQVQGNVDSVLLVARKLLDFDCNDAGVIDKQASKLHGEWTKLYVAVQRRTALLQSALSFQKSRNEYNALGEKWMTQLRELELMPFTRAVHVEDALMSHNALKSIMKNAHEKVDAEGQALFTALQRPPTSDGRDVKTRSRVSDYATSASQVMDAVVEIHELNRMLSIKWEKVNVMLCQKNKLCLFEVESRKVLDWIESTGVRFLNDNQGNYGDDLELSELLLGEHKLFERSAEETRLRGEQLIESALTLAESRECNPHEIEEKSYELERSSTAFFSRLLRRKELLEMTVNFFRSARELSDIVEDLQEDLKLTDQSTTADNVNDVDEILEKHRHVCQSTLASLVNAIQEGDKLSKLLSESDGQPSSVDTAGAKNCGLDVASKTTRRSIETFLRELNLSKQQLMNLWLGKKQRLDHWVQVKAYERLYDDFTRELSAWMCDWKAKDLAPDVTRAAVMLAKYKKGCTEMERLFTELLTKGTELSSALKECDVEVTLVDAESRNQDSLSYIEELLVSLEAKKVGFAMFCADLQTRYEQCSQLRVFESDTKRVSSYIRHGEKILLHEGHEPSSSMCEAEAQMRDYEQFQIAIEKTRLGVLSVHETAGRLLTCSHYDPDTIRSCADTVERKWEQLTRRSERRRATVFASYNFFRANEQVNKLLSKFSQDCRADEDPCCELVDYETSYKQEKLEALMRQYEQEEQAIGQGCKEVRDSSEHFLRQVLPQGGGGVADVGQDVPAVVADSAAASAANSKLESRIGDIVQQVTCQEPFVTKQLQEKHEALAGCLDFVKFETNVKEAIQWIQDHDLSLGNGEPREGDEVPSKQTELKDAFEEIREKVKHILQEALSLMPRTRFHGSAVHDLAVAIDKRYKDLACQVQNHRLSLEVKLGVALPHIEDENEWPSISSLQIKANEITAVSRREVSSDSGIHELTEEKRRSAKRIEFIMNELLQTERAYCNDLKCCIENFLFPMLDSPDVPTPLVGQHEVIFGNIEEIYEFHSTVFLRSLEKYEEQPEDVGTCFVDQSEKFQMYVDYCANKPESSSLLIEHGETFFEDLQARRNIGLPLAAFLIKPVQRITKYQLLLKELLSCCDDSKEALRAGLDVMLSVPRQANDTMYLCMIEGFNEGSLEALGRILIREAFTVWDPKHMRRKGKERHVFLFEQALLFSKEQKDASGKVRFYYKGKIKTSELGITEHIAEDPCKFAVWTGEPPFTDEKRIIKAESIEIKKMWVKELRELVQQFQFGFLRARTSFYPTSPRKKSKTSICTEAAFSPLSNVAGDRVSYDLDSSSVSNKSVTETSVDYYVAVDGHVGTGSNELSLEKGQIVEVLSRPPGSKSWRVRTTNADSGSTDSRMGMVPWNALKKYDENSHRLKRHSVETINSQSSEDSLSIVDGPNSNNTLSVPHKQSPNPSRRRTKSVNLGTLKMRTWSRSSSKKFAAAAKFAPLPPTPARSKTTSGGGAKKLQALLGAPKEDINLLLRPTDFKSATLQRPRKVSDDMTTSLRQRPSSYDCEDAGFQEGDNFSEYDSGSDSNDNALPGTPKLDVETAALNKRNFVFKELIQSERDYVKDLAALVEEYIPCLSWQSTPFPLRGKETTIFGNAKALLDFHRYVFLKELQKCEQSPELLPALFLSSEESLLQYVQYCRNKPRSANVVREHEDTFFEDAKMKLGQHQRLSEYLMKPVHRIMKYQLLLKDITKYTVRANLNASEFKRALAVTQALTKQANDMMSIGMLEGFNGDIGSLGRLLLQGTLYVANAKTKSRPVERRVFLFERAVILSEPFTRKSDATVYIYRQSLKTNYLGLTEHRDEDPCKFALWTKAPDSVSEALVMTAQSPAVKRDWVQAVRTILQDQLSFIKGTPDDVMEHLMAYTKAIERPIDHQRSLKSSDSTTQRSSSPAGSSSSSSATKPPRQQVVSEWLPPQRQQGDEGTGQISPSGQLLHKPTSSLKHVKLISLEAARSLEDLTKPFPVQERFIVLENYQAQNTEEITVHKNDVVFLVSRPRNSQYLFVRNFCRERSGLVPATILRRMTEEDGKRAKDIDALKYGSRIRRAASFGHNEKPKGERPKRSKSIQGGTFRRKKEQMQKKKADKTSSSNNNNGVSLSPAKAAIDRLQAQWTASLDSSDDDGCMESASESLSKILHRESKTTFEVAPEFRVQPRDVTIDAPANVKLTCTLSGSPDPLVTWSKNDSQQLDSGSGKYRVSYKNHVCCLEIMRTHPSDSGTYTATATNILGSASCSAKVTVKGLVRPSSPSRPCITVLTPTSVVLVWEAPGNEGVPIDAYTVEYKEASASLWHVAVPVVEKTSTVVEELIAGRSYQFRVSANNEVGISESSPSSEIIRMDSDSVIKSKPITWHDKLESNYNFYSELGRGRFSLVKKCVEKSSKKDFAAKLVKRRTVSKETVEGEIAVLRLFNHPAICSFHDCYETPKNWIVIMELLPGGQLFDHIIVMDNLTEEIAIGFVKQILLALLYLHDCNVAHLDLKPENLLLTGGSDPKLKLTDFGDAARLDTAPHYHQLVGSPEFAAPEIILEEALTCAADMWSLGVIVYVLLSGVSPFYSDNTERACQNITEVRYKFPLEFFDDISNDCKDFIEELLMRDHTLRPDAKECLNFAWIRMIEPCFAAKPSTKRISLSRLAAFNARRRYQHEMSTCLPSSQR